MNAQELLTSCQVSLAIPYTATGTTTLTGTVDLLGFDGVMFLGVIVTANTGNFLKAGQGDASNGSDAVDLASTKTICLVTGNATVLDVFRPARGTVGPRYITVSMVRAGATTICGGVFAVRYNAHKKPTVNTVASVCDSILATSPAEGTA